MIGLYGHFLGRPFGRRGRRSGSLLAAVGAALAVSACSFGSLFSDGQAGPSRPGGGTAAAAGDLVVRCQSRGGAYTTCDGDTSGGVELVRQISTIRCEENRSWGVEEGQIWVDFGCGGDFRLIGTAPPVAAETTGTAPQLALGAGSTGGLDFGGEGRSEAVRACATYADFKVRDAGADGARADRVVHLREVAERHYQVQAYVRITYSDAFLRQLVREDKPEPRDVFYIDCETVRGQVIHFEYNNFL